MKLPKQISAVTTFSKILALVLFITLPIVGFYLGMMYEKVQLDIGNSSETPSLDLGIPMMENTSLVCDVDRNNICDQKDIDFIKNRIESSRQDSNYHPEADMDVNGCITATDLTYTTNLIEKVNFLSWKTYRNDEYGFEFEYPESFKQITPDLNLPASNITNIIEFGTDDGITLVVFLEASTFTVEGLKKYSPTGNEKSPETKVFNTSTFYYYGPGGGGVCYPDQYFTNIDGQILSFKFSGCKNDKTPSEETKVIENHILSTFRFVNAKLDAETPSCRDIPKTTDSIAGMTYLESYCLGNYCYPKTTKDACETVDVVTIKDRKLNDSWGQDGTADCIWIEDTTSINCQVRYK
ncbi:hypothetical protein COV24_04125 [candidate division WWE3 bacterium CG10_big_fil_rev_8_21_14_0_10_32_10]|uniref:Dockerin domain-containing protein n=1 Tax=candidate division WWE3 bacterium CG10_big_fil_rev_8_21_14_0_10_32_10 TaxID=1975090 RepID=A0A2H0R9L6_UNCKA|nr:MAG: hypothetical protein COV24_04125 [candidate division WWE3 bacterium CG10_big_fil_rev_8_21_14_0_10_32_10]